MTSIKDIWNEHRALEARAAQLLQIVASPVPDPAAVAAVRWDMAQALAQHCAREDREVYAPLLASDDAEARLAARHLNEEQGMLARRFADYAARWPVARMAREWEVFRSDTAALLLDLKRRITREERELHPHLARIEHRRAAA